MKQIYFKANAEKVTAIRFFTFALICAVLDFEAGDILGCNKEE
jgi:DNA-binding Xre family transcriptional regulator